MPGGLVEQKKKILDALILKKESVKYWWDPMLFFECF